MSLSRPSVRVGPCITLAASFVAVSGVHASPLFDASFLTHDTGSHPVSVAAADLNGDGIPDLVVGGSTITVLLGTGGGSFGPRTDYPGVGRIAIGDLNGDHRPDVVTGNAVYLGVGDGMLTPAPSALPYAGESLALGDLDGDGKLDLVMANSSGQDIVSVLK